MSPPKIKQATCEALNVIFKLSLNQLSLKYFMNGNAQFMSITIILFPILIIIVRSDGVFMSRLVDRGGPGRQEIILNCVLQIQKYKVGENILKLFFQNNFPNFVHLKKLPHSVPNAVL